MNGMDHPDLDLCLGSGFSCGGSSEPSSSNACIKAAGRRHPELQQITIFYGGQVCVSDVTDLQAKAIICMAKGGGGVTLMEEKQLEQQMEPSSNSSSSRSPPVSPHAVVHQQLHNPELSMKRSLQRFLQKRKTRLEDSSPYNYAHKHSMLSLRSNS